MLTNAQIEKIEQLKNEKQKFILKKILLEIRRESLRLLSSNKYQETKDTGDNNNFLISYEYYRCLHALYLKFALTQINFSAEKEINECLTGAAKPNIQCLFTKDSKFKETEQPLTDEEEKILQNLNEGVKRYLLNLAELQKLEKEIEAHTKRFNNLSPKNTLLKSQQQFIISEIEFQIFQEENILNTINSFEELKNKANDDYIIIYYEKLRRLHRACLELKLKKGDIKEDEINTHLMAAKLPNKYSIKTEKGIETKVLPLNQEEQKLLGKLEAEIEEYLSKEKKIEKAKELPPPPANKWNVIKGVLKKKVNDSFENIKNTFTGSIRIYTATQQNDTRYMIQNAQLAGAYSNPPTGKKLLKSSSNVSSFLNKLKNSPQSSKSQSRTKFKPRTAEFDKIFNDYPKQSIYFHFVDNETSTTEQSQHETEKSSSEQSSYVLSAGISSRFSCSTNNEHYGDEDSSSSSDKTSNYSEPLSLNHNAVQQNTNLVNLPEKFFSAQTPNTPYKTQPLFFQKPSRSLSSTSRLSEEKLNEDIAKQLSALD